MKNEPLVTGSDKAQSQPDDSASSATSSATSESDQPKQNDSSSGQQAAVVMTADTGQQTGQTLDCESGYLCQNRECQFDIKAACR